MKTHSRPVTRQKPSLRKETVPTVSKTQRAAMARVFKEAARRIGEQENDLCCIAIQDVVGHYTHIGVTENDYFAAVLRPAEAGLFWYGPSKDEIYRFARTLGLLLCAELVREGFVPKGFTL